MPDTWSNGKLVELGQEDKSKKEELREPDEKEDKEKKK